MVSIFQNKIASYKDNCYCNVFLDSVKTKALVFL